MVTMVTMQVHLHQNGTGARLRLPALCAMACGSARADGAIPSLLRSARHYVVLDLGARVDLLESRFQGLSGMAHFVS